MTAATWVNWERGPFDGSTVFNLRPINIRAPSKKHLKKKKKRTDCRIGNMDKVALTQNKSVHLKFNNGEGCHLQMNTASISVFSK